MVSALISRVIILVFGLLYPAYASYKAVKTKNVKEYVKWMMYWIVFALFLTVETFADIFISWFPFYYEVKIVFLLWLLSPATKGSSYLYRKFIHPQLAKRDREIDDWLDKVHKRSYDAAFQFGKRVVNDATNIVLRTAVKGQHTLSEQMRSYSLNDVSIKDSQILRRRQASLPESDEELDNVRLLEDNKELSEKDEDDYSNYTETVEEYPISEAMRKQYFSTEAGLHRIIEEPAEIMTSSRTMRSSKAYTNKEQAHIDTYATLPRARAKKKVKKTGS